LAALARQGALTTADSEALAAALSGAMNELSLWIAAQPSPEDALARARAVVHHLLGACKA
jgi:tetracycline repressor-like protein